MADDDLVYLLHRAAEERRLAVEAVGDEARAAHRGLADAYAERVRGSGHMLPRHARGMPSR